MKNFSAESRSCPFCLEPEPASGPRASRAVANQKSGGSATLPVTVIRQLAVHAMCSIIMVRSSLLFFHQLSEPP